MNCPTLPITGSSSPLLIAIAFVALIVGSALVVRSQRQGVLFALAVLTVAAVLAILNPAHASAAADCINQSPTVTTVAGSTTTNSTANSPTTTEQAGEGPTTTTIVDETTTTEEMSTTTEDVTTTTAAEEIVCGVNEVAVQGLCVCKDGYARNGFGVCVRASSLETTTTTSTTIPAVSTTSSPPEDVTTSTTTDPNGSGGGGGQSGGGDDCQVDCG
jgi:hypothetical protein